MNSRTWWVEHDDTRSIAKWVPADHAGHLLAGIGAARLAGAGGLATGPARPRPGGAPALELDGGLLAVLELVPGEELTGEAPADAGRIGATLARAHLATAGHRVAGAWEFPWVDPRAPHLDLDREVRAAVAAAVAAVAAIPAGELTRGVAHGDPAPEAFLRDRDRVGLIDWGSCVNGPLLYDLASAAMYLGGLEAAGPMLAAYAEAGGPVSRREIEAHVSAMLAWRWAVQADYFARRIADGDRTGIADREGNREGFADARRRLVGR
jgi:homoserine kinase type II